VEIHTSEYPHRPGSRHCFTHCRTTRDAVDEKITRNGTDYVFVDTAGIRRKSKTRDMAEQLSVVMARVTFAWRT